MEWAAPIPPLGAETYIEISGVPSAGDEIEIDLQRSFRRNPFVRWWQQAREQHVIFYAVGAGGDPCTARYLAFTIATEINRRRLGLVARSEDGTIYLRRTGK